jgi:UDP-glucose 4-epimerase
MKIAVTGGAGFIGAQLSRRLVDRAHDVTVVDIASPSQTGSLTTKRADITKLEETKKALRGNQTVYHLAGGVLENVRKSPYVGTELNVTGTLNVLESCRANDVKKIIFASTFYVYDGIDPTALVDEDTSLNGNGMELFGASKLIGENLVRTYSQKYGIEFVVLRFGSAYGAGNCSNIVKTFLDSGIQGKPAVVWGRGHRWNQYTFVGDIADGCVLSLQEKNEIFNLISPEQTSIRELADIVKETLNLEVAFDLTKREGTSVPYMSSEKARIRIKWKPIAVKEGIQRTIAEMRTSIASVPTLAT